MEYPTRYKNGEEVDDDSEFQGNFVLLNEDDISYMFFENEIDVE